MTAIIDKKIQLENENPIDPESHSPDLFVRFDSDVDKARRWLAAIGRLWVTSAKKQWDQSRARDAKVVAAMAIPEPRGSAETLANIDLHSERSSTSC